MDEKKNRVQEALILRGMRQCELREKTKLPKTTINGYVKNNYQPKQKALSLMARALNVSEMWLAGYDVPMERTNTQIKADDMASLINIIRKDDKLLSLFIDIVNLSPTQRESIEIMTKELVKLNRQ